MLSQSQNTLRDRLDTIQRENTTNKVILTRWIAVGTIIAAVYYGIEIYTLVHRFFYVRELYWIWEIPKK